MHGFEAFTSRVLAAGAAEAPPAAPAPAPTRARSAPPESSRVEVEAEESVEPRGPSQQALFRDRALECARAALLQTKSAMEGGRWHRLVAKRAVSLQSV